MERVVRICDGTEGVDSQEWTTTIRKDGGQGCDRNRSKSNWGGHSGGDGGGATVAAAVRTLERITLDPGPDA